MTTTLPTGQAGLGAMARIEARRFVRHPVFLAGVVVAYGITVALMLMDDTPQSTDLLSWPVIPAFFIGLTSLVVAARLTRSTESAAEAMGTAPGTEAQRTLAVALACLVPMAVGLVWLALPIGFGMVHDPVAQEWWFHSTSDLFVWAALLSLVPVACLGGGLLGVVTGRWLSFPGATAVTIVAVVAWCVVGVLPAYGDRSEVRLLAPWPMWHSGTMEDGTQVLFAGNPVTHLGYLLALCAAAVLAAVWHDRRARTSSVRTAFAVVVAAGLVLLALSAFTGQENQVSDPIPFMVKG